MSKFDAALLIFISMGIGLLVGYNVFRSQVVKTYEDGSFIGCYYGALCRED